MTKQLLIVFVKNIKLGKVKTRLAQTIGNEKAFLIYKELVGLTERVTHKMNTDQIIFFSDVIITTKWAHVKKEVQSGTDLGERMQNAFQKGFDAGYQQIVLIGSDLPDLTANIIQTAFRKLENNDVVLGPADDGGYYLIGLSKMNNSIFKNKPWSQSQLLNVTSHELKENNQSYTLLENLNDIDTYEDLIASSFYKNNPDIQKIISTNT